MSYWNTGSSGVPEVQRPDGGLQEQVLNGTCRVCLFSPILKCGLLSLEAGGSKRFCFFLVKDFLTADPNMLSHWLKVGTELKTNARLMNAQAKVPYIATSVWSRKESELASEAQRRHAMHPSSEDRLIYKTTAEDLIWQVQSKDKSTDRSSRDRDYFSRRPSADSDSRASNSRMGTANGLEPKQARHSEDKKQSSSSSSMSRDDRDRSRHVHSRDDNMSRHSDDRRDRHSADRNRESRDEKHRSRHASREQEPRRDGERSGKHARDDREAEKRSRLERERSSYSHARDETQERGRIEGTWKGNQDSRAATSAQSQYQGPVGASTPVANSAPAGTPLADEAPDGPEARPHPKRPRSPPDTTSTQPTAAEAEYSLAKKQRRESGGTPPPPPDSLSWPVRLVQPPRAVQHEPLPPHTAWKWVEVGLLDYDEVAPAEYGHPVTVAVWRDEETGVLATRNQEKIVFHVSQLWESVGSGSSGTTWYQMREVYTNAEVRRRLPVGRGLKCNFRRVDCGDWGGQATAVWPDGPPPTAYRTKDNLEDLQRMTNNFKLGRNVPAPMFSKAREGVVQEYISHDVGLVRLLDDDRCVALFSVEQVWEEKRGGPGDYLMKNSERLLHNYLPLGSRVYLLLRPLPHQKCSQLAYQASLVWSAEFGSTQPTEFQALMGLRQSRIDISAQLDRNYDRFKEVTLLHLLRLVPGGLEPVVCPVALNLLPSGSTAEITSPTSSEAKQAGLIRITLMVNLDQQAKPVNMLALFHIEDVFETNGQRLVSRRPDAVISELEGQPVDLVARSIAAHDSYSGILQMANRITNDCPESRLPILQAVVVFLRPLRDSSHKVVVGEAPLPTFFRRDPTSLNRKQAATAFYFNLTLCSRLDRKVFDYLDSCPNQTMATAQKTLAPCYIRQSLANHFRKVSPRNAVKRIAVMDVNSATLQQNFGLLPHALDLTSCPAPASLPTKVRDAPARIKLVWFDRPVPKYGLVELKPPGSAHSVTALFSVSAVAEPLVSGDLSSRFWCNMPGVRVNAVLTDARHRIPYVVTSIWLASQEAKDTSDSNMSHRLKQEWKSTADQILADRESLNFLVGSILQARENAEAEQKRQQDLVEISAQPGTEAAEAEEAAAAKLVPWRKSVKNRIGVVDRVVNANFAIAVDYQECPGQRDRRCFILFDTCDIWVDGQVAQSRQKKMTEIVAEGDRILYNAVHIDVDNSWNLNYMATAVVAIKSAGGWVDMPAGALYIESAADVKVDKLNNFKLVATKLTKKPPPEDRRPQRGGGGGRGRGGGGNSFQRGRGQHHSYGRGDSAMTSIVSTPWADRKSTENIQATMARRRVIMNDMPELYQLLKPMEIYRQGNFIYDCKACGIQGMSIEDAEDHVGQASHKEAAETEKSSSLTHRFQDRGDAEEALFLNAHKAIKVIERNGRKFYNCQDCKAMNMMFINAKKHVASLAHKKNERSLKESTLLDQECKEMRKRLERDGVVYHCTPCFFQTDSIVKNKDHLATEEHKRLTTLYCHVCKEFSQNKAALEDHRFSIRHRRNCDELEVACLMPSAAMKAEKAKQKRNEDKKEEDKEARADDKPIEEPENFNCKFCNFNGTDKEDYEDHVATASHKRRVFIETQEMPSGGLDAFGSSGGRCNTIEEMCLIREGKDINEQVAKSKTLRDSEEIKKAKEGLVNKLFDHGVFTQMAIKTNVRCNTCRIQLSGKEKMLTQQLIMHLTGEKHTSKLRLQIKAEEHTGVDRNTAQDLEDKESEAAEAAAAAAEAAAATVPTVPGADAALEDIVAWLEGQIEVVSITSQLFYCEDCKTGLKQARDLFKHMTSEAHKAGITEERDWRRYIEWCDVYEHGENIFKCLCCNTDFLTPSQVETHMEFMEHLHCSLMDSKLQWLDANIPVKPPYCSQCDESFLSDSDLKTHEKRFHRVDHGLTADQTDLLTTLSQSCNLSLPPRLEAAPGRILFLLPSKEYAVAQVPMGNNQDQFVNVLFDRSRLYMGGRPVPDRLSAAIGPGCPVGVDAVLIEPHVPGFSNNVSYYATGITVGDREEYVADRRSFASLKAELWSTVEEATRLCRAKMLTELEDFSQGKSAAFFHRCPEELSGTGTIVKKNQNVMVIRIGGAEARYALKILDSGALTDDPSYQSYDETFEVGDAVNFHALLMDPERVVQYLCTAAWSAASPSAQLPRDVLKPVAVRLYNTLAASYCTEAVSDIANLDMSGVLVPSTYDDAVGFNDIADLAEEEDDLAANSDLVQEDRSSEELESRNGSMGLGFTRIKLASFAHSLQK